MSLISEPLASLFNGVSQQPATLRLDSQLESQVNVYGTVEDGLLKRPPTENVAQISATPLSTTAFIHTIDRSVNERYIVVIENNSIKVYDKDGVQQTVNFPQGFAYLASTDPRNDFAVISIADYSFIVNKSVTVLDKPAPSSQPGAFTDWYTPDAWFRDGTVPPESYFNVAQGTFQGSVQLFENLPNPVDPTPPVEGDVWRVAGGGTDNFGSYYVVRRGGVWEETYEPLNGSVSLDELTMPHALVRESNGTFTFTQFAWKARQVGDQQTNPSPTFVNKQIRDVFYYKNRLGFVADENVIFSGAGDFGNFYRLTVKDLLDSELVDVAVSSNKVSLLNFAVPFNNSLMLFADQTQFSLNVDELLTPTTVSVDAVTDYEISTKVRPVPIGNDVYFVTESGNYSRVREYFVEDDSNQTDAADITAHVPRYLPSGIIQLAGNSNEDVLFAISDKAGFQNRVYTYKFHWTSEGKIQSSWSYWELDSGDKIISISVIENNLYLLIERSDGVYLETMNLESGATAGALGFQVYLDRRVDVTGVWSAGPDTTTFTLPYPVPAGTARTDFKIVRGDGFAGQRGSLIDPTGYVWTSDTTVTVPGNEQGQVCHVGVNYLSEFEFSEQFFKKSDGIAVTTGRLMLRTFTIYFTDTAFFSTEVAPYGNGDELAEDVVPAQLSAFTGKTLGEASLLVGEPAFHTGDYSFQIYGDSSKAIVKLKNDTHVAWKIQSAEWEGFYYNRAS